MEFVSITEVIPVLLIQLLKKGFDFFHSKLNSAISLK